VTTKLARDLEPGDAIVSWLGSHAEIVAVSRDGDDIVVGLRPDEGRLGPHDRLARFDADEPVEVE
jgi:hypothetical protein